MENQNIFQIYESIAQTLSKTLYPILECNLIDYTKESLICHNFYKDKKNTLTTESEIPEIFKKNKVQERLHSNIINFPYQNKKGANLKSSAIGIYNGDMLIGCLTLHIETDFFDNFIRYISLFTNTEQNSIIIENQRFDASKIENDITPIIETYILENNLVNNKLKKSDKKEIIKILLEKEFLSRKGAITNIASRLSLSRPTVYRYIKELLKTTKTKSKSQLSETFLKNLNVKELT